MTDDLDDADAQVRAHTNFEGDELGLLLARLLRVVRVARTRLKTLEDRVAALEARIPPPP